MLHFYGTPVQFSYPLNDIELKEYSLEIDSLKLVLKKMQTNGYQQLLNDCIRIKSELSLNDWGYYQLIDKISATIFHNNNSSVLLSALLLNNNGYDVQIGKKGNKLYLLISLKEKIYDCAYINMENKTYFIFPNDSNVKGQINTFSLPSDGRGPMSLKVDYVPKFSSLSFLNTIISSISIPELDFSIRSNENLLDFYNSIPSYSNEKGLLSRYVEIANTPISEEVKKQIYPQMSLFFKDKIPTMSLAIIMHWLQVAFKNGENERTRLLYPEETLFYPYTNVDDRTLLMARIVADVLDLKTLILYYPGHLALGVAISNTNYNGDYVEYKGEKYIICDPATYNSVPGKILSIIAVR